MSLIDAILINTELLYLSIFYEWVLWEIRVTSMVPWATVQHFCLTGYHVTRVLFCPRV